MPVSHLGLTVSHIPSASSFYLSALQPLGYRFIGHQGDSIGLGIEDADFFITQGPRSATIAPTHIAFAADDRTQVRECYTSALKAGGRPSGSPSYRNNECSCFNAAVEDLDGNTVEFIFRENGPCHEEPSHADEEKSRVLTWQEGVSREAADGMPKEEDVASVMSKSKSRSHTALDLASSVKAPSVAEPTPEAPAASSGVGNFMSALSSGITPKAMLGGAIGAVAAGAVAYAFYQSEQDSARAEAEHKALMASYERGRAPSTREPAYAPAMKRSLSAAPPRTARMHRNYSTTESIAPPPPRQHRNFSVTESRVGPRPPPTKVPTQPPTAMRAIEARAFDQDSEIQTVLTKHTSRRPQESRALDADSEIHAAISKHSSRRPQELRAIEADNETHTAISKHSSRRPQELRAIDADSEIQAATSRSTARRPGMSRSQTFDASAYAPMSTAGRSRAMPQRSATLIDDAMPRNQLFLEGPKDIVPSSQSLRSNRDEESSGMQRHDSGASGVSRRSEKRERRSSVSQANTARSAKREGSRYDSSRHEGTRHEGSRHEGSKHESSRTEGSRHAGSTYEGSRHEGSRHEGSRHGSYREEGASRRGSLRDPDTLSDASTIKASRRDSAAHIPIPPSKANSHISRATAAEYRLPDSPVPSYYYPPTEQSKPVTRAQSQVSAIRVPLPPSRAPSHVTAAQPVEAPRRGSQVSVPHPPSSMSRRRASHASGSAAGVPLPGSLASGRGYEDAEDDGLADIKTVVPDDSISCIDLSRPKAPRSDHSRHSERSHRSHRTHQSSRSKRSHHRDNEEQEREPMDAKTIVPDDSISSVGAKPARSEHSHHSHRSHRSERDRSDRKSHHGSRVSKHSRSLDHEKEPEKENGQEQIPLDAQTVLPSDSISSVGAPARSVHSHHSERDDRKSHHSSRSKHSKSHHDDKENEKEKTPLDAQTVLPEDSISSVGAPARSSHSHHSHRSERDAKKSHHSSRSKHSKSHEDGEEKKKSKEGRTTSESGKSDSTVKPAKSIFSAMTLPGKLRGDKEEKKKRSVASYA